MWWWRRASIRALAKFLATGTSADIRTGTDRYTSFAVDYAVVKKLPNLNQVSSNIPFDQFERPAPALQSVPPAASGVKPVALSAIPTPNRFDLQRAPAPLKEWVGRRELLQKY